MATNKAFEIAIKSGFYTCKTCEGIGTKLSLLLHNGNGRIGDWSPATSSCPTCLGTGLHMNIETLYNFILAEISEAHYAIRKHRRTTTAFIDSFHKDAVRDMLWKVSYKRFLKDTLELELADIYIMIKSASGYMGIEIDETQLKVIAYDHSNEDDFVNSCLFDISKNVVKSQYHKDRKTFLTDALSILVSLAAALGIPFNKCIEIKMRYNETRSDLHEGE